MKMPQFIMSIKDIKLMASTWTVLSVFENNQRQKNCTKCIKDERKRKTTCTTTQAKKMKCERQMNETHVFFVCYG